MIKNQKQAWKTVSNKDISKMSDDKQKKPVENKKEANKPAEKKANNKPNVNKLQNNELLRLSTAGSVDDGKSTLIGRLLYDTKSVMKDQYEAVRVTSKKKGEDEVNLAYLTDGLKSEREQGITIDVAYRYFNTENRKFIIFFIIFNICSYKITNIWIKASSWLI